MARSGVEPPRAKWEQLGRKQRNELWEDFTFGEWKRGISSPVCE